MRWKAAAFMAGIVALTIVGLDAQTKPSFAGKWVAAQTSNGRSALGQELTIAQDANTLTLEYMTSGANPSPRKFVYKLDASESRNTNPGRSQTDQVSKATWTGATLVIMTKTATGDQKITFTSEGDNLIVEVSTSGFGPAPNTIVYKRAR